MLNELPSIVAEYIRAVNSFNTDAIIATFAKDALVNDNHREIAGTAALRLDRTEAEGKDASAPKSATPRSRPASLDHWSLVHAWTRGTAEINMPLNQGSTAGGLPRSPSSPHAERRGTSWTAAT